MTSSFVKAHDQQKETIEQADRDQREGSDPRASVFVSASAGSGKTKLLIDRLLRLMLPLEAVTKDGETLLLEGSDPARILCLTYTKAAAAEMANRLQDRLGRWVSLPDEALGRELVALDVVDNVKTRERARGLFLKVLDIPGGLRVETIHAFCQSLLKRFPLEAALDPHFSLIEETDSSLALRQSLERELVSHPEHARNLAGMVTFQQIVKRIVEFNSKSGQLQPLLMLWKENPGRVVEIYRHLLDAGQISYDALVEDALSLPDEDVFRSGLQSVWSKMTLSGRTIANNFVEWLATPTNERSHDALRSFFLTKAGAPRKMNYVMAKEAQKDNPPLFDLLCKEAQRQFKLQERMYAQQLLSVNQALLGLAFPVLSSFQKNKQRRGMVDYNDLIAHTRNLLRDPGAAWVMYKLDGGIDHLLLDEVQDTSSLQWEIAGALTSDFFTGEGRYDDDIRPRTVFAVGDFKQSIYSFQGAEPEQFHRWRREFSQRVRGAGLLWRTPSLKVSFRSVEPVLRFVDSVFSKGSEASEGLLEEGSHSLEKHRSARTGQGGRVEIWPLVPDQEDITKDIDDDSISPWRAPQRNSDHKSAPQRLAEALAEWISNKIGCSPQLGKKPLSAGDVLVLVPKRSSFLRSLIRALKTRHVPVASFIRTGLTEQVAVRDLMTLCTVLLLPQDNLSLASVLTSPLGGISDDSLMDLVTADRTKSLLEEKGTSLWGILRDRHCEREEWKIAWENLSILYRRVDYDTPYSVLVRALGPQGGRARLLARLGPEAAESVDELLNAALMYESQHSPSLQGFLHWLEASDTASRREGESDVNAVRVMTVHGAKGLQSRLVVLPDTTSTSTQSGGMLWSKQEDLEVPLWVPNKKNMATERTGKIEDDLQKGAQEEKNRLLYVALTRASDMLVVCGWEPKKKSSKNSWYQHCERGFEGLEGVVSEPSPLGWGGHCLSIEAHCSEVENDTSQTLKEALDVDLPAWMGGAPDWQADPAPLENASVRPLAPSRPDGVEFGPTPTARSPLDVFKRHEIFATSSSDITSNRQKAMQRGRLVHRLLQLLPDIPLKDRAGKAHHWLSRPAWKLKHDDVIALCDQIMGILEAPQLAPLFGEKSLSEQAISGVIPRSMGDGKQVVLGKVDRFCLEGRSVWLCDYKTGRRPPRDVTQTPSAYLRQMAAYRAVMAQVYPEHDVRCFLVWTEGPQIVELPKTLLQNVAIIE